MPRPVWRVEPRTAPAARSGWVTKPTTGCGPASSASNVGSANRPVPIITIRIAGLGGKAVPGGRARLLQRGELFLQHVVGRDLAALLRLAEVALQLLERRP